MDSSDNEPQPERSQTAGSSPNKGKRQGSATSSKQRSQTRAASRTRASTSRHNKLWRGPPTPPPEVQYERERSFVLDCKAVSQISNDYSVANPKLGSAIPPYNSQLDKHADTYFQFFGLRKTLEKNKQLTDHESIPGQVHDRFSASGHGFRYLSRRNRFGSGHSIDQVRGHDLFLSDPKPVTNYNGLFGYRRNTPSLRRQPTIGTTTIATRGIIPFGRFSVVGCGNPYAYHCQCKFDQPCRCHNQDKHCECIQA